MQALVTGQLYLSSVTVGEVETGHAGVGQKDKTKQAEFRKWMKLTFGPRLVVIDKSVGETYGLLKAKCCAKYKKTKPELWVSTSGFSLGIQENDLWLVAQAMTFDLTFITTDAMCQIKKAVGNSANIEYWPLEADSE